MARIINVLLSKYRNYSFYEFISYIVKSLYLNEPYIVYKLDIQGQDDQFFESAYLNGIQIQKGVISELEDLRNSLDYCPYEFTCNLVDDVEDFFVAKNEEGIQHISWIYSQKHHNRLLTLGEYDVEIKHCLTMPALRGRGVYPKVIQTIIQYFKGLGGKQVFMCVHTENQSSIRGIEKAGFSVFGQVRLLKVVGVQFSRRLNATSFSGEH